MYSRVTTWMMRFLSMTRIFLKLFHIFLRPSMTMLRKFWSWCMGGGEGFVEEKKRGSERRE